MATTQNYYKIKHGLEAPSLDAIQVTESTFPKVRPSLSIDFANSKSLDDRVAFTRSTNATYYDASGTLRTAYMDQPRIDFDPVTRECKGLLVEEQRTNLWEFSERIAGYGLTNVLARDNAAISPNGTFTAFEIIPTTVTNNHYLLFTTTATTAATICVTFYAKNNGYRYAWMNHHGGGQAASFDLVNGVVVYDSSNGGASITYVGNGWYRCKCVATNITANPTYHAIGGNSGNSSASSTGNGNDGLFIWGVQVEYASFPTSYIPSTTTFTSRATSATYYDSTGIVRTAGRDQPRYGFGYDTVTGKWITQGLILEAAATNLVDRSTVGNIGSSWQQYNTVVLTPNYTTAPDLTMSAGRITCTSLGTTRIATFSLTNGTIYSASIWVKSNTASNYTLTLQIGDANVASITATPQWQRFSGFGTPNVTGYNFIDLEGIQAGADISVWGAQLETGYVTTSYIPTISGGVTRAADVSTSASTTRVVDQAFIYNITPWYNSAESTLYGEGYSFTGNAVVSTNPGLVQLDDGTNTNRYAIRRYHNIVANDPIQSGLTFRLASLINGVTTNFDAFPPTSLLPVEWDDANKHKAAFAIKTDTQAAYADGLNAYLTSAAAPPYSTPTRMAIGSCIGAAPWNGHISKVAYYSKFLTNAEMQALTK